MLSRRQFLGLGASAIASAAAVGLYAWQVEPHWLELVRRPMPLPGLPPDLVGRTLLHLSDLHVGPRVDSAYLIRSLHEAGDLEPDYVAITGDFVSWESAKGTRELSRVLRALPKGKLGTVASLGNHDYGPAWSELAVADRVTAVVADAGVTVLRNESAIIGGLQFAGLADYWSPEFFAEPRPITELLSQPPGSSPATHLATPAAALGALDRARPTVVLCHNPDAVDEPIWGDLQAWVLAGHTHGGQCKPPFLPPPILPVRNKRYTAGTFDIAPGRTLYINRGLGYLIQVRFNVRPEMTLFTLA